MRITSRWATGALVLGIVAAPVFAQEPVTDAKPKKETVFVATYTRGGG